MARECCTVSICVLQSAHQSGGKLGRGSAARCSMTQTCSGSNTEEKKEELLTGDTYNAWFI